MTRPVVDLAARRTLRRDVRALVDAHPELTGAVARERCATWLEGEEPDEPDEPTSSAGRRNDRPASRSD